MPGFGVARIQDALSRPPLASGIGLPVARYGRLVTDSQPLPEELVARLRRRFGSAVAQAMGYPTDRAVPLATEFTAAIEGSDVRLRFKWSGREESSFWDGDEDGLEAQVTYFALGVADLKEHRGRERRALPWDTADDR